MKKHGLTIDRSLVIPNGISHSGVSDNESRKRDALVYIGSITEQHGILNAVRLYIDNNCTTPFHIFGGGQSAPDLLKLLNGEQGKGIVYHGYMAKSKVEEFLISCPKRFIGLAPYTVGSSSHTAFGDSLKIKEYIEMGMPYLTTTAVTVPSDLVQFGKVYTTSEDLVLYMSCPNLMLCVDPEVAKPILNNYLWKTLFSRISLV
jgi:glycosyltransferase involved in cell wall biosynthesis